MRSLSLAVLALALAGCGQTPTTMVHGQPVPHWIDTLQNPDARQRRKAVKVLSNVGLADPAVLPALTRAVVDHDPLVRCEALQALLKIGPDARDALPAVEACRKDQDPRVRAWADRARERIQPAP